jgi:hypothetical protein
VKILENLSGGTNIISLLDTIRDPVSKTNSLIFGVFLILFFLAKSKTVLKTTEKTLRY